MPRTSDSLESLQRQYDELTKKIKLARRAEKRREAEMHKRRCEIIGAAMLKALDEHPDDGLANILEPLIDRHTTKARERKVLGLKPRDQR